MGNSQDRDISLFRRIYRTAELLALLLLIPSPAWAVQAHGGAEGLVSHQLGHILFFGGMAFLLFQVQRKGWVDSGWQRFKIFLILILFWNIVTFTGHWLKEYVPAGKYILQEGQVVAFRISGFADALFYICSLDHLVLVPAFIFLALALRSWRQKA